MHRRFGPVRITVSKTGVGYSVGGGPLRVTKRADGRVQRTVRIPGTGIHDTRVIGGHRAARPHQPVLTPSHPYSPALPLHRAAPVHRTQPTRPTTGSGGVILLVLLTGICWVTAAALAKHGTVLLTPPLVIAGVGALYFAKVCHAQRH
ncbi:DUF4236 domain-containing protein [Nocardia acididurans]